MSKTDRQAGVTTNYGYDNIYQLFWATPSSGPAESYTYDPVGNRVSSAGVPCGHPNHDERLREGLGRKQTQGAQEGRPPRFAVESGLVPLSAPWPFGHRIEKKNERSDHPFTERSGDMVYTSVLD